MQNEQTKKHGSVIGTDSGLTTWKCINSIQGKAIGPNNIPCPQIYYTQGSDTPDPTSPTCYIDDQGNPQPHNFVQIFWSCGNFGCNSVAEITGTDSSPFPGVCNSSNPPNGPHAWQPSTINIV